MTIASETNRSGPYDCNGATTSFPYEFKIYDERHIRVVKTDASGVETTLTIGTHYTVSGVGASVGGAVTTTTAYAAGNQITLVLKVPFTQNVDLENQGAYFAETIERAIDLQTQMSLQLKEQISRAIVLPVSETQTVTISAEVLNDVATNAPLVAQYKDEAAASAAAAAASAAAAAVFNPANYSTTAQITTMLAGYTPTTRAIASGNGVLINGGASATLGSTVTVSLDFATQAESEAGTATNRPLNALRTSQAITARTKVSSPFTPTLGGLLTWAHGLASAPVETWATLICITAEMGYSIGDETERLTINSDGSPAGTTVVQPSGILTWADGTNVYGRVASSALGVILDKSTGGAAFPTTANWKIKLHARL